MRIDAHVHLNAPRNALLSYGMKNELRFLSIITDIPGFPPIEEQLKTVVRLKQSYNQHVQFAGSFSCQGWGTANWLEESLDMIRKSMDSGAVGIKVWKNIGMSLKDEKGNYIMIDHPSFEPIFQYLEENGIAVLGHNGEPKNCWLPLQEMTVASDKAYFSAHPEFHMYLHQGIPDYQSQLDARNSLLRRHPNLRFVGLHLASQEWDTSEVGGFLDKFPNAMVDTAERIGHLQYQAITDWQKVYDFFIDYQDRIIYGSDFIVDNSMGDGELIAAMNERHQREWNFFSETKPITIPGLKGPVKGLGLPETVVEKICNTNAEKAYRI